jgi:hypothetical protein
MLASSGPVDRLLFIPALKDSDSHVSTWNFILVELIVIVQIKIEIKTNLMHPHY